MNGPLAIRHSRLLGLGECRASRLVTNDDLARTLDTSDGWIRQRTGIAARRVATADESVVTMATEAGRKALADAGVDPAAVGLVVLATCSLGAPLPGGAARVAYAVGAAKAGAFDLNAACAGFCYAVGAASDAVRAGSADYVLVVAAERMSDLVDWSDRSTAILFADGAGAAVIGPATAAGIGPLVSGSDGGAADLIGTDPAGHLRMDGPAVFRWATTSLADVATAICAAAGIAPSELAAVVPHQANQRIVDSLARQLGATDAVVADDITTAGNTSSASIPLALARLHREGRVGSGDLALILGFGAGLTWAGTVIAVP
ncbi:MAG TPA: beta-ketoacyl-ACP synthase III [Mycobacteriales bacterium]|nr:beta-ketoacyl-ACP synthase III [Mycobacteriales bacterium]